MKELTEVDYLKVAVAMERAARVEAEARVARAEQQLLVCQLYADYDLSPTKYVLDAQVRAFVKREEATNVQD